MAKKTRTPRLGRGLSSLMNTPVPVQPAPPAGDPPAGDPPVTDAADSSASSPKEAPASSKKPATDAATTNHAASDAPAQSDGSAKPQADPSPRDAEQGGDATQASLPEQDGAPASGSAIAHIDVDAIAPNRYQPRQQMDKAGLQQLAASIRQAGLMQPIVLRPIPYAKGEPNKVQYELIAGERRWRAAQLAEMNTVPALIRELDDEQAAEWALIENIQREDLNAMDRAEAFQRLGEQFRLSHEQIAERVGFERSTVSNLVRLLSLAAPVRQFVRDGLLSMGQARALASLPEADQQSALARRAIQKGMSVRQVEQAVRQIVAGDAPAPKDGQPGTSPRNPRSALFKDLERQIGEQLGTRVQLKAGRRKGTGQLSIEFFSIEQFDNLLERMDVKTD